MATQQSIDHLVGLAVAMLGVAPGTKWLNERAKQLDGGDTLADIANEIQSSTGFEGEYPAFLTNERFATDFLEALLGDHVTEAIMMASVDFVAGQLAGATRGELALALVEALTTIAREGEDNALHADFGKAAAAFHNKVMVAKHYTEEAREESPSASVLEGVTDDPDTVMAAKEAIDNPPAPPESMEGRTIVLTPTIDTIKPGDGERDTTPFGDEIVAQPVQGSNNTFQEVLNPFDTIDGGGGADIIHIFGTDPDESLSLGAEDISNVESVSINTVGGIDADLTDWSGLESVHLRRFGDKSDVKITVDDGATITSARKFGGEKATLVGASGAVDIEATGDTAVYIGSAGQTESVKVKGGASVLVNNGAGGQSQTVTTVSVDDVKLNDGEEDTEPSGTFDPMQNTNGFLVGQDGRAQIGVDNTPTDTGTAPISPVGLAADGLTLTNAITGNPIIGTYSWNDDGVGTTDALAVTAQLKFDVNTGGLVFGKIVSLAGSTFGDQGTPDDASDDVSEVTVRSGAAAKTYKEDVLDGVRVPASVAFTTQDIGKEDADPSTVRVGAMPTLTVKSDSIAEVHLHNTRAIALVENQSKTATGGAQPEDLAVTVDGYGTVKNGRAVATEEGKLCVDGTGSAKDIDITVAGASNFRLASDEVESLDINAGAALWLKVHKFDDRTVSTSLKSITVKGEGGVTMDGLNGMSNLASIDAGESSGKNSFKSTGAGAELAKLKTAMGGSGSDTFALTTSLRGNLESVHTGEGNDVVMVDGDYRDEGLRVDLGAGEDTFHGSKGNSESRIDGGDGRDTLRLTSDGLTYKDGTKTKSIYENFEILDLGGGSGPYDVGRLGVDTIVVKKSTGTGDDGVTLNNVGAGTTVRVEATSAGTGTVADVKYNFANDVNTAGSLIDGGTTNILNVSLMAKGGEKDTTDTTDLNSRTGAAELMIELDEDLVAMTIDSDASVHRTAAGKRVTSRHYENKVTVTGTSSALEEVKITGDAQTNLGGTGLISLEYVNAAESGAGVTVEAGVADNARVRLVGGNHDDKLTSGDFAGATAITTRNVLMGNGGDDMLNGGDGMDLLNGGAGADTLDGGDTADGATDVEDRFIYNAASESQVSFSRNKDTSSIYDAKGYDVIQGFTSGTDKLHLSKDLVAAATAGQIVGTETISNGIKLANEWDGWKPKHVDDDNDSTTPSTDDDGTTGTDTPVSTTSIDGNTMDNDGGARNLFDFIGDGKGLFLTSVTSTGGTFGSTTRTFKNSFALVNQSAKNNDEDSPGTWLLIDVDSDGNFVGDTDMVIFLEGTTDTPAVAFLGTDISP